MESRMAELVRAGQNGQAVALSNGEGREIAVEMSEIFAKIVERNKVAMVKADQETSKQYADTRNLVIGLTIAALAIAVAFALWIALGISAGLSRLMTVADAVAAIDYALQRDPDRVVVFGHSLGGAVGIRAAAERPAVRGVVAESTFSNYREIAAEKAPWISWLVPLVISAGFDPDEVLASLPPAPLLVIHGERDHIVPVEVGELLYERAREPKALWKIPEARHMSPWALPARRQEFEARLLQFFAEALASERRPR